MRKKEKIFLSDIYIMKNKDKNNNYIISIDLNTILQTNNINDDLSSLQQKLNDLISEYYSTESFNFSNNIRSESFKDDFIYKFQIEDSDLMLFDKIKYLNSYLGQSNEDKFLKYNQGVILIDLSMVSDKNIISNINYLYRNFSKLSLNKIYDNYLIHFKDKLNEQKDSNPELDKILLDIFYRDLQNLNLWQKIQNIPNIIKNKHMKKKIETDLSYMNNIRNKTYKEFYSGVDRKFGLDREFFSYEKTIYSELKNEFEFEINYDVNTNIESIHKDRFQNILNKLSEYNSYLDNIHSDIDRLLNINDKIFSKHDSKLYLESDSYLKNIKINDMFNVSKLSDIYSLIKIRSSSNGRINSSFQYRMSDILDKDINIHYSNTENNLTNEEFISSTIVFLNEIIKKKIQKIIKMYNFLQNEKNIMNNMNLL